MYESFSAKPIFMAGDGPHDNIDIEAFVQGKLFQYRSISHAVIYNRLYPNTLNIIQNLFSDHKRSTLRKLSRLNMYEVWEDEINDIHIVAFADEHDPEGTDFVFQS